MSELDQLRAELQGAESALERLEAEYGKGAIDIDRYLKLREQREIRIAKLKQKLDSLTRDQRTTAAVPERLPPEKSPSDAEMATPEKDHEQKLENSTLESGPLFKRAWESRTGLAPRHLFASSEYLCLISDEAFHVFSAKDGKRLLPPSTTLDGFSLTDYTISRGATAYSDALLLTLVPQDSGKCYLLTLRGSAKKVALPELVWLYEAQGARISTPLIHREAVYVVQYTGAGHELFAVDYQSGQVQHTVRLGLANHYNPYLDCASLAVAAEQLCLSLCDGKILRLDHETGWVTVLKKGSDGLRSSPVATDGKSLFFRTYPTQNSSSSGRLVAWDVLSREMIWEVEMEPDFSGRHRPLAGWPLIIHDVVCAVCGRDLVCAFDLNTGRELWRHSMPDRIEVPPVWVGEAVVVADRAGNMQALQFWKPKFEVTYDYAPETPPTLGVWHPLNFTVLNIGYRTAYNTALRIRSDNFRGVSDNQTRYLGEPLAPGKRASYRVELEPKVHGSVVHMPIEIEYEYDDDLDGVENLDLFISVVKSPSTHHSSSTPPAVGISETYPLVSREPRALRRQAQPAVGISETYPLVSMGFAAGELEKLLAHSRSVGKLEIPKYRKGKYTGQVEVGTAWVIAPGLALTCWHVVATTRFPGEALLTEEDIQKQIDNARLIFGFTAPGLGRPYAVELAHANRDKDTFDYAILRIKEWDNYCDYLPIDTRAPLVTSTKLWVLSHPLGQLHQAARGVCLGLSPEVPQRVLYRLDTASGSSGGSVFDAQSLLVVAIHRGQRGGESQEGVRLRSIWEDLSTSNSKTDLYQEIEKAQKAIGGR